MGHGASENKRTVRNRHTNTQATKDKQTDKFTVYTDTERNRGISLTSQLFQGSPRSVIFDSGNMKE